MRRLGNLDPRVRLCVEATAAALHKAPFLLMTRSRESSLCEARQVAMYVVRMRFKLSLESIGHEFDRDHTTVLHACQTIA